MKSECAYFIIGEAGGIQAVANETAEAIAAKLGDPVKTRASHVLPANPIKRAAFRVIRFFSGDNGRVAQWCRNWRGPWLVYWKGDRKPSFGHVSRRVCIKWEISQLERRFAQQ
jgi:hypothetical protein